MGYSPQVAKSRTRLNDFTFTSLSLPNSLFSTQSLSLMSFSLSSGGNFVLMVQKEGLKFTKHFSGNVWLKSVTLLL